MGYLYHQELFKLLKRRSTAICLGLLLIQNFGFGYLGQRYAKYTDPREFFASNYGTTGFIVFIMIAACASVISTEFEYHTIKSVVTQAYSRQAVLVSKWLAMLTYSLVLYGTTMGMAVVTKLVWSPQAFALSDRVKHAEMSLGQYWLVSSAAGFLTLWLLLSVVFLLAAMLKKGLVATTCGIVGYFALGVVSRLMFQLINKWDFLKWNPVNFLNYPTQLSGLVAGNLTHLSNTQLLAGNLAYIVLFMGLGLYFFSQKEV